MAPLFKKVEEIVLAVKDQDKAVSLFEALFGLEFHKSWTVPADHMQVKCAMVGDTQFHIVASTKSGTLIDKYVSGRGEGLHHVAFRVNDLDSAVAHLRGLGVKVIPETPRTGREGSRYAFVHPRSVHGLLIELIER
ncbi:MAG: VOC family protein [Deltaproteobacteria bacterium]|nr:VOC family protein [Deltaproteobacteria bacterium]MBW1923675.1 VOC family protein [Deltaproteobacteria bacterium]MBW1950738.1 VOC family protein [Deltaproteobacteria bacterium]MBW2008373.1 VOC family protein [Deltaproteobacteria bacterium]MBW2102589.1 VOC family protein [Deltaproteobacteria bacterium]